jgi:hypothetical protein
VKFFAGLLGRRERDMELGSTVSQLQQVVPELP